MKRVLSFVLVMLMAFSTVLAGNTLDASAATGKVKSIKVTNAKKKKVSIVKGKTKTLKVKVTVKGKASKKYTFKSSKKSVVTAKKSGKNIKLTAKKAGTAKITIKSKANKKKKVVIKVTVTNPPAKAPDTPVTPVVEPETHVAARDYILEERIVPLKKGTKMKDLYIPFQVENDFTVTKVSNTPKGLKGEKINDKYLLNGTPTETGVFKFAVTVKDKVTGEKNTTNVTFVIGSDDEVQAYCPVISGYYCVDGYNTVKQCTPQEMIIVGGSGNFKVSAVGGNYNMFDIEEGDEESYYVTYVVTGVFDYAGEFSSAAKIQDIVNGEIYACDLKLNITQGERISGRVTDMAGKGVEGLDVVARSTTFYSTVFTDTTDANGTYIVYVAKDSYSINVQNYDLSLAEVEAASINKATTLNFKVQGYTVNLVPSNSKIDLSSAHWYSDASYSKFYGTGSKLFMPAGTYNIYYEFFDPEGAITSNYVAKASFSVSGEKTVTVNVETMSLPYNAGVISGVSELMNIDGDMTYYRFTPVQSGAYTIRSVSPKGKDVDGYLYGPQGEFINFNADGNNIDIATEDNQTGYVSNGIDFKIKANLEAGRTYYIAVTDCNDRPDLETTVIIERVEQQ